MATVQLEPWSFWFKRGGGRQPSVKVTVYYKWKWADDWTYAPDWTPISAVHTAAPAFGQAAFKLQYGKGWWEDYTEMLNTAPESFAYCYVQIRSRLIDIMDRDTQSNDTPEEAILWTGVMPAQSFRLLGRRTSGGKTVHTSDQILRAHSLDWLLETRLDGAWVEPVGGGDAKKLGWLPTFNQRYVHGGNIIGNMSAFNEAKKSYIFADTGNVWKNWGIIDYLLKHYQTDDGPFFQLAGTTEILTALGTMSGVYDFNSMTLRGALNALMNRSRGMGWKYTVSGDGKVFVVPFSLLDEQISFGDFTMPASPHNAKVDMWGDPATINVSISEDISRTFDELIIRGARVKSACSLRYTSGELEKGWSDAEETAYKDAAKNVTGYDALSDDDKKKLNDKFRAADRFERVFTTFRVPRNWDWLATDLKYEPNIPDIHIVNPKLNDKGEIGDLLSYLRQPITANQAVYYNVDKRFLAFLPFLAGYDYSTGTATNNNPTDAEPEYRKMFVLVKDGDGKYQYAEKFTTEDAEGKAKLSGGSVRPLSREMGFEMKFRPAYMAAKDNFSGAEDGISTDKIADEGIDYTKIIATVFVETDQFVQMSHKFGDYENQRVKTIDIPDAELWYVTPDTIIDVDDAGDCILYGGSDNVIRDDRPRMRAALAAGIAWYGKRRNKVVITIRNVDKGIPIGYMVEGGDAANVGAAATPVTSVSWSFEARPTTTIRTDFGELDIAGIFGKGGGGGAGRSGGTVGTPSPKVAARKQEKQQAEIELVKAEQNKQPLRPVQAMSGAGGSKDHTAYCKTDAGEGNTLVCYLDEDWSGEGDEPDTITVTFPYMFGAEDLEDCVPWLKDGDPILVGKIDGQEGWFCKWWINNHIICAKPS